MKLLQSRKFELPKVYFISDRTKIKDLVPGVPFIYGDPEMEKHLVRVLEYEVLYQEAIKSGYPFDFKAILKENGFTDIQDYAWHKTVYMNYTTSSDFTENYDFREAPEDKLGTKSGNSKFKQFVKDSTVYVDIQKLKALKVFPVWLNTIEEAVHTNIHNFAVYNENMYNKKLEGMYGSLDLVSPPRNLIVIDISSSIPRGVSSTTLTLAKNLAETFFADLLITGSKSTLYAYEEIHLLNIETIYDDNGMDNDQAYFRNLVTSEERKYRTAIVFGDNHSPCRAWRNKFNINTRTISRARGQKMCKWEIEKVISFHTTSNEEVAGYADWFQPETVEKIQDWVKFLNN